MSGSINKYQVATAIAILFHTIGAVGMLFFDRNFFLQATPFNLLLTFGLLVWTQENKNLSYIIFLLACMVIGIGVEIIGVRTGLLFGDYQYGSVLGYRFMDVPLLIGVNWFTVIYCSAISVHTLMNKLLRSVPAEAIQDKGPLLKALSLIMDGALLAVFFDWLMEPVAVKLGYWEWTGGDGGIPIFNYICWFGVSVVLLSIFHCCRFSRQNKFAVNLLLIQLMFFLILRTFLK